MRTEPSSGPVPGVEGGVVLGFPCPGCGGWARPLFERACGHYGCVLCGIHTEPALLAACYSLTRSFMPAGLTYS